MPELSSSVGTDVSATESALTTTTRSTSSIARPHIHRHDSTSSQARGKHTTPIDLEKVVSSIQEKRRIEPLSPLPEQLLAGAYGNQDPRQITVAMPVVKAESRPCEQRISPVRLTPECSTSTVATTVASEPVTASPPPASQASPSTDLSPQSVVHGFTPGCVSTSIRSSNSNPIPTPILKSSSIPRLEPVKAEPAKKKKPMFTLGGSSDEDPASSFEHSYMAKQRSNLTDGFQKAKTASFNKEVTTRLYEQTSESEGAIETDSEDEYDHDNDNAIATDEEGDSDDEGWEDEDNGSGASSLNEEVVFKRVDSQANLKSRPSLLTRLMHQDDRAQALQNLASRSTPHIRRSRASSPNGPSTGNSPPEDSGLMMRQQAPRGRPIIMTTSNMHQPRTLSPRTTRRNMLQTEMTQSLRQNLLWERHQKQLTTGAVNKRAQSAVNLQGLNGMKRAMTTGNFKDLNPTMQERAEQRADSFRNINLKSNNSFNEYFDQGLQEYHQKGW